VHAARLKDGTEVIVKVRRPAIERIVEDDLAIMEFLAARADGVEELRGLRLPMLVDEFAQGIRREQNLLTEAANTHKFWVAFRDDEKLLVPRVYWDYCTPKVLTLQRLKGTYVSELEGRANAEALKREVASIILDRFMVQFFRIGSFHADPHSGNVLVTDDRRVALIDFGLIGRLGETLRAQLSTIVAALAHQNLELAADVLGEIGSLPPQAQDEEFRSDLVALLDRHYSVPLEKIDVQVVFGEIMQVVRKYRVVMPRDFVLFGKTIASVGGLVTRLSPELSAARLAAPYARKLALGKLAPGRLMRSFTANAYHLGMLLRSAPFELRQLLRRLKRGAIQVVVDHRGLERYLTDLDRTGNRLALSILLAAILLSSTSLLTAGVGPAVNLLGWKASALGLLGYFLGFILGVWLALGIFRSGRI